MALNPLNLKGFQGTVKPAFDVGQLFESYFNPQEKAAGLDQKRMESVLANEQARKANIESQYAPQLNEAEIIRRQQENQWQPQLNQADIANKQAQAFLHNQQAQREQAINDMMGGEGIPPGSINLRDPSFPANYRLELGKQQSEEIQRADMGRKILKLNGELKKIQERNPNLSRSFANAMFEVEDPSEGAYMKYLKRHISNKRDLADAQLFSKHAAQMAIELAAAHPGRETNQLRALYQQSKPAPGNEYAANMQIFDALQEEFGAFPGWHKALLNARSKGVYIPPDPYLYADYGKEPTQAASKMTPEKQAIISQQAQQMGFTLEDVMHTAEQKGLTPEEVIRMVKERGAGQ